MAPAERVAAIDVGTNTVLLSVVERRGHSFQPVVERAEITRLGRGVDRTGRLDPAAIAETVAVIARYAAEARSLGATRIAAVATSAARDAGNGAEFFEAARAAAGLVPEVIAGGEEARLVHLSAWRDFGAPGRRLAVLDVGGGSSEVTWGGGPVPDGRRSFQMGAVRLTERIAPGDPPSGDDLRRMQAASREALLEVTETAVALALPEYDAARVHGSALSLDGLRALLGRLAALTTEERARLPGMEPKRADVIVAGAVLVVAALELGGFDALTVSDRGVRWGLLHDRFGSGAAGA
ncbi:MAG: Ppx/GppA family phosphatase [Deltaproteobacteria bacterium]|nr:Ppx/GppA family phosphatase [Deltaproteobacteria bacterium]